MVLPFSMAQVWEALGSPGDLCEDGWPTADNRLPEGTPVAKLAILFAKIEDEVIAQERERLTALSADG